MKSYNVLTGNTDNLERIFSKKFPKRMKFLTIAPHSGEYIPSNYLKNIDENKLCLKKDIDYKTDEIYDLFDIEGGLITTNIHRNFVDLNRSVNNKNNGVIKSKGFDGNNFLINEYTDSQKESMFSEFYIPFYNFLNKKMFELREKYGVSFLLNGHSMESNSFNSKKDDKIYSRPDFCVGTLDGTSATEEITDTFVKTLTELSREESLKVEVDYPFSGQGNLSKIYSFPRRGYNTLLLEVNKRLYVNEDFSIDYESLKDINGMIKTTMEETLRVIR
jgi:N-formylglutamate amidohydrolase